MTVGSSRAASPEGGRGKHSGKSLLLVEDSRVFSTLIRQRVEGELGAEVTHCASLAEVRRATSTGDFAVAVLDLNLPDAPNCEALDHVIAAGIPAIVFTGTFNDQTRADILSRDVVDCIVKTAAAIPNLLSLIDRTLGNRQSSILIVDPNSEGRGQLARLLHRHSFRVVECADLSAAQRALTTDLFELVLCRAEDEGNDRVMDLLGLVQMQFSEDPPPLLVLSDTDNPRDELRYRQAGSADVIRLPLQPEAFLLRVDFIVAMQKRIQSLHRLAARDYLTDLFNRRYFFQHGPRIVEQSLRSGTGAAIAVLDIDHFKRLNDTYGHEVGDLVLKAVARNLRHHVGEAHLLARLGGEEFGILFGNLDVAAASAFCETLRASIAMAKVVADDEELSVTVSMGIASIEGRETFDNYLNAADQFLYMAKHGGRNRIVSDLSLLQSMAS